MDFVVPFDQLAQVPPGPYMNANPSAGQRGSIINATVFPAVQNELLALQDEAGLTRDSTNLKQVLQALRSGKLTSFLDTGTADALIVTPLTAYVAVALGTEITVLKGAAANATVAPTLAVGALTHPITKEDGSALAPGDLPADSLFTVKYDGSNNFRVVGLRKSDTAQTIPANALWHVGVDTSGSAATIVATVTPAVATRLADAAYLIIPAHACAGATQINVGFGAPVALTRNDGTALQANDYAAGQPLAIIDDGAIMRIVSLTPQQVQQLVAGNSSITNAIYNLSPGGLRRVSASAGLQQQSDIGVTPAFSTVLATGSFNGASFASCGGACALHNTTGTYSGGTVRFALIGDTDGSIQTSPYVGGGTGTQNIQIPFTVPSFVFTGLDRTKTYHVAIYAQRSSADGAQSTWDPSIFVQHDGN